MYKTNKVKLSSLKINESSQGEPLHEQINRALNNGEDIAGLTERPLIHTEKKLGVIDEYDIRGDKFERSINAVEKANETMMEKAKKRREKLEELHEKQSGKSDDNEAKGQPISGTSED